jgi:hypothetical protein
MWNLHKVLIVNRSHVHGLFPTVVFTNNQRADGVFLAPIDNQVRRFMQVIINFQMAFMGQAPDLMG